MGRPPSPGPKRMPGIPVRYLPVEERFAEAAREKEFEEQLRPRGISRYGKSEFLRAGAMDRAERILGMTLAEFESKEATKEARERRKGAG